MYRRFSIRSRDSLSLVTVEGRALMAVSGVCCNVVINSDKGIIIIMFLNIHLGYSFNFTVVYFVNQVYYILMSGNLIVNKTDLQALSLSRTYCHKTSTQPPAITHLDN